MGRAGVTDMAERLALAIVLGFWGLISAVISRVLLDLTGWAHPGRDVLAVVVTLSLVAGGAHATCRLFRSDRSYPALRRFAASALAVLAVLLAGTILDAMHIKVDALSDEPGTWALAQELISMAVFYGTLIGVPFLVLRDRQSTRH